MNKWVKIERVERRENVGLYAPLTLTGTAIVNGVLVSNYAYLPKHQEIHLAFLPLRTLYKLFGQAAVNYYYDGVNWYASLLMKISENLDNDFNYNYFLN